MRVDASDALAVLDDLADTDALLERPAADAARAVVAKARVYPAPLPHSRRTYRLRGGWRVEGRAVLNAVPYAPLVQGAATQARPHRGRWSTDDQLAADAEPALAADADREVMRRAR